MGEPEPQPQLSKNQKKKARQKARKAQLAEAEAQHKSADAAKAAAGNRQVRHEQLKGQGQGGNGGPSPNWAVGVLCEAQYTDGKWYAAKITEKMGKGKWKILYTEYNEEAVLKSAKLRMRAGGGGGGGGGKQQQKQGKGKAKGNKKQESPPDPKEDDEDEDDEDYEPEEDEAEDEEEERRGLVVTSRKRVKAHKIGCMSAFPHIGSKTALPVPDREVASHLEEGMEVLVKGKTGTWVVGAIMRNKATLAATDEEQAEKEGMQHTVLLRDVILDEEQLENEVQTPTRKEILLQMLAEFAESEEEEDGDDDDEEAEDDEDEADADSTPVGHISFNFAAAKASTAGAGGATGGVFGFSNANTASSDTADSPAPGAFSFSFGGAAASSDTGTQSTAPTTFDGGKFNFKPLGGAAATPAATSTTIGGGSFAFKLPGTGNAEEPKQQAWPDASSSSSPSTAGGQPSPYEVQVGTMVAFYAKVDPTKDEPACRAIIDKRRGASPALSEVDFTKLCKKLKEKYNEDPAQLYVEASNLKVASNTEGKDSRSAGDNNGSSSTDLEGATDAERSFNRQVDTLAKFYSKHDASKTRQECAGIIRKRSGCAEEESVPIAPKEWVKLCGKLGKKYGEDPLALGVM